MPRELDTKPAQKPAEEPNYTLPAEFSEEPREETLPIKLITNLLIFAALPLGLHVLVTKTHHETRAQEAFNDNVVLSVGGKEINYHDQAALEQLMPQLIKLGSKPVDITLSRRIRHEVIFQCSTTGDAAQRIFAGEKVEGSKVTQLVVDAKALAEICDPYSWVTSNAGPYSVKTDGAVAMGTIKGEIGHVRYT